MARLFYERMKRETSARAVHPEAYSLASTPSVSPNTAPVSSQRRTRSAHAAVMTRSPLGETPTNSTERTAGTRETICDQCAQVYMIHELKPCLLNGYPGLICWRCEEEIERWLPDG